MTHEEIHSVAAEISVLGEPGLKASEREAAACAFFSSGVNAMMRELDLITPQELTELNVWRAVDNCYAEQLPEWCESTDEVSARFSFYMRGVFLLAAGVIDMIRKEAIA